MDDGLEKTLHIKESFNVICRQGTMRKTTMLTPQTHYRGSNV